MMSEQLMTESEWTNRQASKECATYGHEWQIISNTTGPVRLVCDRPCGDPGYTVRRSGDPLTTRPVDAPAPSASAEVGSGPSRGAAGRSESERGDACQTSGCPGDRRYAPPGRGHLATCDWPTRYLAGDGERA